MEQEANDSGNSRDGNDCAIYFRVRRRKNTRTVTKVSGLLFKNKTLGTVPFVLFQIIIFRWKRALPSLLKEEAEEM